MPQPPLCQSRRAQNVRLWNKSFAEGDGGNEPEWGLFIFFVGNTVLAGDMAGGLAPRAEGARRRAPERRPDAEPCAARGVGRACRDGTARHRRYLAPRGGRAAGDVRPRRDLSPSAASASQRAFEGSLCHGKWCSDCLCLDCPIGRSPCPRQMGRALSLDVRRSPSLRRFRVSPGRGSAEGQGTGPDVKARRPVARTGRMDYGLKR